MEIEGFALAVGDRRFCTFMLGDISIIKKGRISLIFSLARNEETT